MLFTNRKATRPTLCSLLSTDPNSWFETSSPIFNTTAVNIAGSSGEFVVSTNENGLGLWKGETGTSSEWPQCLEVYTRRQVMLIVQCNREWLTDNSTDLLRYVHTKPLPCQVDQIWRRNGPLLFIRDRFFSWAVYLHRTFLLLSAFGGSGGNKNRSSTTSDCLHVQKGRVLNRSPAYLYKTVYTLLLLSFFSFWDQHPKNVVDLYRRVDKRLHIKKRKEKCATEPIVSCLKVPFTQAKRNVTARTKNDTWPFESTL